MLKAWLANLRDDVIQEFNLEKPDDLDWEEYRDRFIKQMRTIKPSSRVGDQDVHSKVQDGDDFDFGEETDDKLSDNPIVQIIIRAGKNVSFREIVELSGLTETTVKRNLQEALRNGEIQAVGAGRKQLYRMADADSPVVGQDDVGFIHPDSAFLLVYADAGDGQIMKVQTLGGPVQVSASGKQFMANMSHEESARWVEALDRLIEWRWVKAAGSKGQIYELTGTGHKKAKWLKENMEINTDNEPLDELKGFEEYL